MPIQIGAKPESDFTDPVGMLQDCHPRIERFLGVLRALGEQATGPPLTADHRKALETSLRYFREGAPRHVQDEETSLFPRLRNQRNAKIATALVLVERLEKDHSTVEAWHQEIDVLRSRWLEEGVLDSSSVSRFRQLARQLSELYAQHIQAEDSELFPVAASILPDSELSAIGQEMAKRRGLPGPNEMAAATVQQPATPDAHLG
jgi:hemerythrin-like domain-containing protein